jgi:hypothetical protein
VDVYSIGGVFATSCFSGGYGMMIFVGNDMGFLRCELFEMRQIEEFAGDASYGVVVLRHFQQIIVEEIECTAM